MDLATLLTFDESGSDQKAGTAHRRQRFQAAEVQPHGQLINQYCDQLHDKISDLRNQVDGIIQNNQNEFFVAFRAKMNNIMRDMQLLKEKADAQNIKMKKEQRMVTLNNERDWFRSEALMLNKLQKDQKLILESMKVQLETTQEERDYYQQQLYEEKMQVKELTEDLMREKTNAAGLQQMRQSTTSLKRMQQNMVEFEESPAVREYKMITGRNGKQRSASNDKFITSGELDMNQCLKYQNLQL